MPKTLERALQSIFKDCLKIKQREKLLIFADTPKQDLAIAFLKTAHQYCKNPHLIICPELSGANIEPEPETGQFMKNQDAVIILTSHSLSHTRARRAASKKGTRMLSMPGVTEEMLIRNVNGHYKAIIQNSRKLADIMTIGRTAHLVTSAGTNLTYSLVRMKGHADTGMVHESGQFSNFPAGEASAAPTEGTAKGVIVVDGSFPRIGKINTPVHMRVKDGFVIRITGGPEAEKIRQLLRPFGKHGKMIAEVGIGTNPNAAMTGITLEDEKKLGTAHVALGNNVSFDGRNNVPCHFDCVLQNPTLTIDGKLLLQDGELRV